jgi:hypothetical protein
MVKQLSPMGQKMHEKSLNRKYIRTENAWNYAGMDKQAERIDPSHRQDIVKLRQILDQSLHSSKGYITKKEIFEAIGCESPYHGNPRCKHINRILSSWYANGYVSFLPEELEGNSNSSFNLY